MIIIDNNDDRLWKITILITHLFTCASMLENNNDNDNADV